MALLYADLPVEHPLKRGEFLKGAIYGNYFLDELLPQLHEASTIAPNDVPEWDVEKKHAYLLEVEQKYSMVDILHTDSFSGHIHAWNMGFLRSRRPDVVVLTYGQAELCNQRKSLFDLASSVHGVARKMVTDFGVGHVVIIAAIPLCHGIGCAENKYRKRVYGYNEKLEQLACPRIGLKYITGFWKDGDDVKVYPSQYAPDSFTPGPEPSSPWFKKYVKGLRAALLESITILKGNDQYELTHFFP